ncbi:hypothetical protein YA0729_27715 [Pseudomonas simiae]|uniref:hypothetical protein n=1 Tax=Pseudomonas simiae TaxID=321846 RepID=UPI0018E6161C|nr:hypothetical protein [Pseudomonas simiae]MBI6616534.1 hypothetical protein [Pseudomonas simiae]
MQQRQAEVLKDGAPIIDIPSPIGPIKPLPADQGLANEERKAIAAGDLDKEAAVTKHSRDEKFRDHLSNARIGIFWLLVIAFMAMLGVLIFHWITPWCFLSASQLDTIKTIIGTALASKIFAEQSKHL